MNALQKVSEITTSDLADYLNLAEVNTDDSITLSNLLSIAKAYIQGYTGLTAAQLDEHADFIIVVLILVQDMYDTRTLYVDNANLNNVVDTILGMHRVNLL
jgi:hypothetical protein